MKIDITTREATMVYELLHEIKMRCVTDGSSKENRETSKKIIKDCNALMKKVEDVILSTGVGEGKPKKKGRTKSVK
jgi:hypothetical protein